MNESNVIPFPHRIDTRLDSIDRSSELVDICDMTLAVRGFYLEPDDVTTLLGVAPTTLHRRGDRRGLGLPDHSEGAWVLRMTGTTPVGPDDLLDALLRRVPPPDSSVWGLLRAEYEVTLVLTVFLSSPSSGFSISSSRLRRIGQLVPKFEFELFPCDEAYERM